MKWQFPIPPSRNDMRIRRGFLWFPKRIGYELRWLENAIWRQRYVEISQSDAKDSFRWIDYEWIG